MMQGLRSCVKGDGSIALIKAEIPTMEIARSYLEMVDKHVKEFVSFRNDEFTPNTMNPMCHVKKCHVLYFPDHLICFSPTMI